MRAGPGKWRFLLYQISSRMVLLCVCDARYSLYRGQPPLRAATFAAGTMERLEERTGTRRRIGQGKLKH